MNSRAYYRAYRAYRVYRTIYVILVISVIVQIIMLATGCTMISYEHEGGKTNLLILTVLQKRHLEKTEDGFVYDSAGDSGMVTAPARYFNPGLAIPGGGE